MTIGNWIAVGALILSALSFTVGRTKDRDTAKENYIKMNMKLDQL